MTPSGFLFSRLLAAVEREQEDDGDRENGKHKSVDDWNQGTEARNAPFLRGRPVCETDRGPGGLNPPPPPNPIQPDWPIRPRESFRAKRKGVSHFLKKLICTNGHSMS